MCCLRIIYSLRQKGALKSRDLTTRHQIKQIATGWTSVGPGKKSNVLNEKRIKSCLSRFDTGAYSLLQYLRAVSHSFGAHAESLQPRVDNSSNSNSSEDEDENRQAPVQSAPTSGTSESATAAAATGNNLGRLLQSVHRGATCWLRTGAVRT